MLYGTASVELADGSKATKLTARGLAEVEGESKVGVIILEPSANDVLIGMAFLRVFQKALFVTQNLVFILDESRTPENDEPGKADETTQLESMSEPLTDIPSPSE
jgi:hypothetical protein